MNNETCPMCNESHDQSRPCFLPEPLPPVAGSATCSTVPFHEANLDRLRKVTLLDGAIIELVGEAGDKRRVEVWRVKEEEGYCIRIFRPTKDGKTSKLVFGLKPAAAQALHMALGRHLSNAELSDRASKT